jgi:hypothetical protein
LKKEPIKLEEISINKFQTSSKKKSSLIKRKIDTKKVFAFLVEKKEREKLLNKPSFFNSEY